MKYPCQRFLRLVGCIEFSGDVRMKGEGPCQESKPGMQASTFALHLYIHHQETSGIPRLMRRNLANGFGRADVFIGPHWTPE